MSPGGDDPLAVVRRRMGAQLLTGTSAASAAEAVAWSGAVQAQEYAEALWSLGMRAPGCTAADVEAACDRGEILRTHVMRPTWHFVAAADVRWLLRLTGPRVQAKGAGRYRELGLDAGTLARADDALARTATDGEPRTRKELAGALAEAGIDSTGQRIAHIVMHAELEGILCSGPRRGRHHTYVALDELVPAAPARSREDDVAQLVLRYFTSHGPASVRDFAWWSGLTVADAKAGISAAGRRLVSDVAADGTPWAAAPGSPAAPRSCAAFLLGTYDEMLVAYRDLRSVCADDRPRTELRRSIMIDGQTIGSWTRRVTRREVRIEMELHETPTPGRREALHAAADRFGAFLGLPATLALSTA